MDAASFINAFNGCRTTVIPVTVRPDLLNVDYEYSLHEIKRVVTKYGPALVAILSDPQDSGYTFQLYLPKYYLDKFTDTDLESVKENKFKLIYDGLDQLNGRSYLYRLKM